MPRESTCRIGPRSCTTDLGVDPAQGVGVDPAQGVGVDPAQGVGVDPAQGVGVDPAQVRVIPTRTLNPHLTSYPHLSTLLTQRQSEKTDGRNQARPNQRQDPDQVRVQAR